MASGIDGIISDISLEPFRLRYRISGELAGGFRNDTHQSAWVFTIGKTDDEFRSPLLIYFTPTKRASLIGTDGADGEAIRVPDASRAVYHDGLWLAGEGALQRRLGDRTFYWSSAAHSITLDTGRGTLAIRARQSAALSRRALGALATRLAAAVHE